jgi:hypothetical protein
MKKIIIASIVGALILFFWQFFSYGVMNFHKADQAYTPKEKAIIAFLQEQGLEEGGYVIPNVPEGSTSAEREAYMKNAEGKPWAKIQYHKAMDTGMGMNMIRGFVSDFAIIYLFCWILGQVTILNFRKTLLAALAIGFIVFLNSYYINYIWFKDFDIKAKLVDSLVSWGLVGLWLGFYMNRRKTIPAVERTDVKAYEMAS